MNCTCLEKAQKKIDTKVLGGGKRPLIKILKMPVSIWLSIMRLAITVTKILPKPLKTYYYQTKIRKGVGFNYPITAVIFMKTFGLPIYILFKKLFKKQGFIVTLAEYKYTRMELEGRLAQFIFLIAYGHPESDIRGTERIHDVFLGKVERDKDVYIAGLEKQQQNLAQLKASRRPKEEIAQVKKNIESLKKRILEMGQFEKDYSYLLEEARRIGFEIKKKREEILNQSGS